jgi:hypothetical protein
MSLLQRLQARFAALPVDTTRVARHIAAGHVALGDFLQTYDVLMQAWVLSRPPGRSTLAVGDSDLYTTRGGARCVWRVVAMHPDTVELSLSVLPVSDKRVSTVYWNRSGDIVTCGANAGPLRARLAGDHCADLVRELFAKPDYAAVWEAERHRLDLFDWDDATASVCAEPSEDRVAFWRVSGTGAGAGPSLSASFNWTATGAANVVTGARGEDRDIIRRWFVKPPVFSD